MSLVPRTPYSSASSEILFQLEVIPSVAETIASERCNSESFRIQIQSFAKMSSFASRAIERASLGFSRHSCRQPLPICCSSEQHC